MRHIPGNVLALMALAQPALEDVLASERSTRTVDEESARMLMDEQRAQEQQRDRLMAEPKHRLRCVSGVVPIQTRSGHRLRSGRRELATL